MGIRKALRLLVLPLLPAAACGQAADEYLPIFDGESLHGWTGDARFWSVQDGVLVGESTAETPCRRSTYLTLDGSDFADFELLLEFRFDVGNSGVQFRSQRVGHHVMVGYQADLESGPTSTGTLYDQFGRGVIGPRGERVTIPAAGEPSAARFADEGALLETVRQDQWTELRVLAVGRNVKIWIDGMLTSDVTDDHAVLSRSHGAIGLQLHSGPPMRVEFRELRLRDLGGVRDREPDVPPQWLWSPGPALPDQEAWFAREFELDALPPEARLFGSADDRMEVYVNGRMVATSEYWRYYFDVDVLDALKVGTNTLTVWCGNDVDDAGFWLEFRTTANERAQSRVYTDPSWRTRTGEPDDLAHPFRGSADAWQPVHSIGPLGCEPWARPRPSPRGPPDPALDADRISLPEGFRAELVYSVPRARKGSWISLAVGRSRSPRRGGADRSAAPRHAAADRRRRRERQGRTPRRRPGRVPRLALGVRQPVRRRERRERALGGRALSPARRRRRRHLRLGPPPPAARGKRGARRALGRPRSGRRVALPRLRRRERAPRRHRRRAREARPPPGLAPAPAPQPQRTPPRRDRVGRMGRAHGRRRRDLGAGRRRPAQPVRPGLRAGRGRLHGRRRHGVGPRVALVPPAARRAGAQRDGITAGATAPASGARPSPTRSRPRSTSAADRRRGS